MASIKKAIIKAKEYITSKQCSNGRFRFLNLKENVDRKCFECCITKDIDLDKMYYRVKIKNLFREKLVSCNNYIKKIKLLQDNFGAFSKKINALSNIEYSYKALYIIKKCSGDKLCQN